MTSLKDIQSLLGLPSTNKKIKEIIKSSSSKLVRHEQVGTLADLKRGIDLIFHAGSKENEKESESHLLLRAVHLFAAKCEGHLGYKGELPSGVSFGDTERTVIAKLGKPIESGGGNINPILKRPVARWLKYDFEGCLLAIRFGNDGGVSVMTFYAA